MKPETEIEQGLAKAAKRAREERDSLVCDLFQGSVGKMSASASAIPWLLSPDSFLLPRTRFAAPGSRFCPPGAVIGPKSAVFRSGRTPPFAAGARFRSPGASFRPPGVSMDGAGTELLPAGSSFVGRVTLASAAVTSMARAGCAPISWNRDPAASSSDAAAQTLNPGAWSTPAPGLNGHPAGNRKGPPG
jgi:hypothetical protein